MNTPTVIAKFIDNHFEIELQNWTGINTTQIEHLAYAIHKQSHIERAKLLNAMRKQEVKVSTDAVVSDGNDVKSVVPIDDQLIKEIENVR